ncbi:MAG: class I SAM-dependent methyltransferase [Actinomycetota bacterium]|nr:class I SAM-dependent methyltransferase [Actinomycetota bacterium]
MRDAVEARLFGSREPVPPRAVRASVGQPSRTRYREEGRIVAVELERTLVSIGRPLRTFSSICDLASGPGKVLCRLDLPPAAKVAALDVNQNAIAWLSAHLDAVDARVGEPVPPTSFEESSFDLLFSISLFTHLPEPRQDLWLAEVARLLRPDGVALLTVHGETAYQGFRAGSRPGISAAQLASLRKRVPLSQAGFVFEQEPSPDRRASGIDSEWGLAFHCRTYIEEAWSRYLDVVDVLPAALNFRQDGVIVRKPQVASVDDRWPAGTRPHGDRPVDPG